MSTSFYHIEGFGVDIPKEMKIYDSSDKEYYEGTIDPKNGADWNQTAPIDTIFSFVFCEKYVSDF